MTELSLTAAEKARKAYSRVLQAMQAPGTGCNLAQVMGTSESTISRIKSEKLEDVLMLVTHLGFKLVSADRVCVDRARYEAIVTIAQAAMACPATARQLVWDEANAE